MLSEDAVRQIYFRSNEKVPDAIFADDVDIVQFANKVAAYVAQTVALQEHERCVEIVGHLNREVAKALKSQRPNNHTA